MQYVPSKKEMSSLSTVFIFSKHNMYKYVNIRFNNLIHKLNKFHRHVTNKN
jgi:hypothetical protein